MTPETLAAAANISKQLSEEWAEPLTMAMEHYAINTPVRQAAFIGQIAHESAGFTMLVEDLNYSATRLMQVWPKRFSSVQLATLYAHNPEKLANFVYADRLGNGDEKSGDGWKFRGRSPIMLTGRSNYEEASRDLFGTDRIVQFPDHVAESPFVGATVSARFWYSRGLNDYADRQDFEGITRRINGGLIGLDDRLARIDTAMEALA